MEQGPHENQQPGLQPAHSTPTVHPGDDKAHGGIPDGHNDQSTPDTIPLSQGFEAMQANGPHHLSHPTQVDYNPPSIQPGRPWKNLQSMHSQHLRTFEGAPAQPFHGMGALLDFHMQHNSFDLEQARPNQNDFFQGYVFPEPSIPTQPVAGPNTGLAATDPSLGFDLNQETTPDITTQGAETASVASTSTTSSGARGRRARGEVRRGQPKPNGWTEDEVRILLRMYAERDVNENVSAVTKRIARTLGKSTGAVEAKHWRLRGGDPKASKNRRGGCGGRRGGKGGRNGRGGSGGAGGAGLAV